MQEKSLAMNKFSMLFALSLLCSFGNQFVCGAVVTRTFANLTLVAKNSDAFALDVDLDGVVDFNLQTFFTNDPAFLLGFDQVAVPFGSPNGVVIDAQLNDGFPNASLLTTGNIIGPGSLFSNGSFDRANLYSSDPFIGDTGNFGGKRGFLGFRFDSSGQFKFGFADIAVSHLNSASPFDLTLYSVSYEDIAGQSIIAAVPEPASGLLVSLGFLSALLIGHFRNRSRKVLDLEKSAEALA